jgi:hypothetical protein
LLAVVQRLAGEAAEQRYPNSAALLADLDSMGADVPPNAEAWERLLRHVREHAAPEAALRRMA